MLHILLRGQKTGFPKSSHPCPQRVPQSEYSSFGSHLIGFLGGLSDGHSMNWKNI